MEEALLGLLVDSHCHPENTSSTAVESSKLDQIWAMCSTLSTMEQISYLHTLLNHKIVAFYGLHPWFSHSVMVNDTSSSGTSKKSHYSSIFEQKISQETLDELPDPIRLEAFLETLERYIEADPDSQIGEIGLDRAFTVQPPKPKSRSDATSFPKLQTSLDHQQTIAHSQIDLAIKHKKNVSFHSVRASQITLDFLAQLHAKPGFSKINLCLHSFGGSPESIRMIQKKYRNIYFSFSYILSTRTKRFDEVIKTTEAHRILLESDVDSNFDQHIWDIFSLVKEAKGWTMEETVQQIHDNQKRFLNKELL